MSGRTRHEGIEGVFLSSTLPRRLAGPAAAAAAAALGSHGSGRCLLPLKLLQQALALLLQGLLLAAERGGIHLLQ